MNVLCLILFVPISSDICYLYCFPTLSTSYHELLRVSILGVVEYDWPTFVETDCCRSRNEASHTIPETISCKGGATSFSFSARPSDLIMNSTWLLFVLRRLKFTLVSWLWGLSRDEEREKVVHDVSGRNTRDVGMVVCRCDFDNVRAAKERCECQ